MSNDIFSTQVQDDVLEDVLLEDDDSEIEGDEFGEVDPDDGDDPDDVIEEEMDDEDSEF